MTSSGMAAGHSGHSAASGGSLGRRVWHRGRLDQRDSDAAAARRPDAGHGQDRARAHRPVKRPPARAKHRGQPESGDHLRCRTCSASAAQPPLTTPLAATSSPFTGVLTSSVDERPPAHRGGSPPQPARWSRRPRTCRSPRAPERGPVRGGAVRGVQLSRARRRGGGAAARHGRPVRRHWAAPASRRARPRSRAGIYRCDAPARHALILPPDSSPGTVGGRPDATAAAVELGAKSLGGEPHRRHVRVRLRRSEQAAPGHGVSG